MTASASKHGRQEILPLACSPIMRKGLMPSNSICRLLTLLLILLCFEQLQAKEFRFPINFNAEGESTLQPFEKTYDLWNSCSKHFVRIKGPGRKGVDARGEKNATFTKLILKSVGANGLTSIQGIDSKLFLCFSKKGRLRAKATSSPFCEFNHTITDKRDQFKLAVNPRWYIGFKKSKKKNRRAMGKPLPGYKNFPGSRMEKCYNFFATPTHGYTRNKPEVPVNFNNLEEFDPEPELKTRITYSAKGQRRKNRKRGKRRRGRGRGRRRQKKINR